MTRSQIKQAKSLFIRDFRLFYANPRNIHYKVFGTWGNKILLNIFYNGCTYERTYDLADIIGY